MNKKILVTGLFYTISVFANTTETHSSLQKISKIEYEAIANYIARAEMLRIAELEIRIKTSESFFKNNPTLSIAARDALIVASGTAISFFAFVANERSYVVKRQIALRGSAFPLAFGAFAGLMVSYGSLSGIERDQLKNLQAMSEGQAIANYLSLQAEHKNLTESVLRKIKKRSLTP